MSMARNILAILAAWPIIGSAAMRSTHVSMSWPNPDVAYDAIQNDEIVSSNGTEFEEEFIMSRYDYDSPCEYIPIPSNITRVPFPVAGGRVQFSVTSPVWSGPSDIDRNQTGEYWISIMVGQLGGYDPNKDKYSDFRGPLMRHEIEADDFRLGRFRTFEPEVLSLSTYGTSEFIKGYALDGLDATLGVRIQYRAPDSPGVYGHLNGMETILTQVSHTALKSDWKVEYAQQLTTGQCAYIRFTSEPSGPENPCPSYALAPEQEQKSGPNRMALGLGIVAGLAIVLVIAGLWWRRRQIRKRREAEWPQGPDGPELPAYPRVTQPAVIAEGSTGTRVPVDAESDVASKAVRTGDTPDDAPPAYSEQPPQYGR